MGKQLFARLLVFLVASVPAATAQRQSGVAPADTGSVNRIVLLDPGLSLGRAVFLFPSSLGSELSFSDPSMTLPGGGFPRGSPGFGGFLESRADLMSPLRLQWAKERNLGYFQMMLGAFETGAVGYMAYRHVKKYGLFR